MQWGAALKQAEHHPVLLEAAVEALAIRPDGLYVDGTYGRGGHSRALLGRLGPQGRLLAFDKDPQACADGRQLARADERFTIHRGSFARLTAVLEAEGLTGRVDGLLLDLGVSSPQLDDGVRGFSFMRAGPLDMRMDPEAGEPVSAWLARADRDAIIDVLRSYGDEPFAPRIADAIVREREQADIGTTQRLAAVITDCLPRRIQATARNHPATRSFQALRIFINRELDDLSELLEQSLTALAPAGRMAVIAFHSLEDRRVKRFMRDQARPAQPALPMAPRVEPAFTLVGKPVRADESEMQRNPRARSAIMRVAERTRAAGVTS